MTNESKQNTKYSEPTKISKILVPLDDSDNSKRALIEAVSLARLSNASITGIYVISSEKGTESFVDALKPLSTLEEKNYDEKQLADANGIMGESEKICKDHAIPFKGIVAKGTPGNKIVQYAQEKGYDHIVIGMTGKGHVGEVLLGSVSYYVIHHADIPVTVVK